MRVRNLLSIHIKCLHSVITLAVLLAGGVQLNGQTNADLAKLISLKKGFRVYDLPQSKMPYTGFFVLEPGVAVVPADGGLFMPSIKKWLMLPALPGVISADQIIDKKDSALALVKADVKNSRILLQKNYSLQFNDPSGSLVKMPFGFYDIRVAAGNRYYIWGAEQDGSKLYLYDEKKLRPLYTSAKNIKEIDLLDENNVLMIEDNNILAVSFNAPPKTLVKLDQEIDGIATDTDGSVYVSTTKGILHYASLDDEDYDLVTNVIHGKLRIYRGRLFVLWKEQGKMVEIKLR